VVFIPPEEFYALPSLASRANLGRFISILNGKLGSESFICVGPGRWGTNNPDLGVRVTYSDIYHTRALVELTGKNIGGAPEASFGTHFFQDLVESKIFPLAIYLEDEGAIFNHDFFYQTFPHDAFALQNIHLMRVIILLYHLNFLRGIIYATYVLKIDLIPQVYYHCFMTKISNKMRCESDFTLSALAFLY
jgi:hypothetical protein